MCSAAEHEPAHIVKTLIVTDRGIATAIENTDTSFTSDSIEP